jgi:general secretion pathway protein G
MLFNRADRKSEKGFSLIELIVVLVILGLLAAVVGPRVYKNLSGSKSHVAKIQIEELGGALQMYSLDMGRYPDTSEGLEALVRNPGNSESWNGPYVSKPQLPKDPWGKPYVYRCPGMHGGDYDLFSLGPDGADGGDDDIVNWK